MTKKTKPSSRLPSFDFDIDSLLHPARAFEHPRHVVNDPDLTLNEKRAILASWASDACAVESVPPLRQAPGSAAPVGFDDIMDALHLLDREAADYRRAPHYRAVLAHRKPGVFGRKPDRGAIRPGGERQSLN